MLLEGLPSQKKLRSKEHASFPCLKEIMGGDPDLGEEQDSSGSPLAPKSQNLRVRDKEGMCGKRFRKAGARFC